MQVGGNPREVHSLEHLERVRLAFRATKRQEQILRDELRQQVLDAAAVEVSRDVADQISTRHVDAGPCRARSMSVTRILSNSAPDPARARIPRAAANTSASASGSRALTVESFEVL